MKRRGAGDSLRCSNGKKRGSHYACSRACARIVYIIYLSVSLIRIYVLLINLYYYNIGYGTVGYLGVIRGLYNRLLTAQ